MNIFKIIGIVIFILLAAAALYFFYMKKKKTGTISSLSAVVVLLSVFIFSMGNGGSVNAPTSASTKAPLESASPPAATVLPPETAKAPTDAPEIFATPETPQPSLPNADNVVYLTFDDGPSKTTTVKILDVLKKYNVKATFFILDFDSSKEYIVKRMADEGHTIGIHGYSHDYEEIYASEEAFMENLTKLETKIKAVAGVDTKIIRFPGGSSGTVMKQKNPGIMTRLTKLVLEEGYYYMDWNVDCSDAVSEKTSDEICQIVTKALKKGRANVVLMHDFESRVTTAESIEGIIQYAVENGYVFDRITEQTSPVRHSVSN